MASYFQEHDVLHPAEEQSQAASRDAALMPLIQMMGLEERENDVVLLRVLRFFSEHMQGSINIAQYLGQHPPASERAIEDLDDVVVIRRAEDKDGDDEEDDEDENGYIPAENPSRASPNNSSQKQASDKSPNTAPKVVSGHCPVCTEDYADESCKRMPCGHIYHADCIIPWLRRNNSCPLCRHELPTDNFEYENAKREKERRAAAALLYESMYN